MNLCVYTCFVYLQPFCVTLDFKLFIDSIHILFLLYLLLWFWDFTIKNLQDFIKVYRALIKDISLHITLPSNLEGRLARLTQLAKGGPLSRQGLAYFMKAVLNAAIRYQALNFPHTQDALHHARQQVRKAWGQHGGWHTSFAKEAMMAHWRYYRDNTGALVDVAYAKHAAHLLHRVTHNHQPEVREAAAIHIKEAQMARNTCRRWILAQLGVPTSVVTGIWAQLQLLLRHHMHAILTNHHCDQQGPLVATHTDIHRHPTGELDTLRLVGATITIVYITPTQMKIMAECDADHAPFLSDPQCPARCVFQAYLRACATKAECEMPGPKDIDTASKAFPRPRPTTADPARASTRPQTTATRRRRSPSRQPKAGHHPPSCY